MSDTLETLQTSKTSDYVGLGLALLAAVLAIAIVLAHVYLASLGQVDTIVTLLLNVMALTFSTVCTIWVGRWSAQRENKAFIRAALRTTYGLHEGLEVAERSAVDGVNRMKDRTSLSPPAVSELWEEVVGRMLDQVRGQMRRAQETIANWREFLPEEVAMLNVAEQQKATALNEVTAAASQARAILREIGEGPNTPDTAALRQRIEALEQEKSRLSASSAFALPATGEARKLLAMGALEEAIAAYSSLIETSPDSHSLYLQRARARYIAGDSGGALEDLKTAEEKYPADSTIIRLREEIQAGRKLPRIAVVPAQAPWKQLVERGHSMLAVGKGEEALEHYRAAREAGLLPVFAVVDEAMALIASNNTQGAKDLLRDAQGSMTGPFMRVHCLAVLAVANALSDDTSSGESMELQQAIENLKFMGSPFRMADSPLQYLVQGLRHTDRLKGPVREVFRLLLPVDAPEA